MFGKLVLFDLNEQMTDAWGDYFVGVPDVAIHSGPLEGMIAVYDPDMISSAANSFGIMGAGIDGALRHYFPLVQKRVKAVIAAPPYCGEMAIGCSAVVEVEGADGKTRRVAYTPTMHSPGSRTNAENVYRAARAVFVQGLLHLGNAQTLAVPGMGTGIGRVPHQDAARVMRSAYDSVLGWENQRVKELLRPGKSDQKRSVEHGGGG